MSSSNIQESPHNHRNTRRYVSNVPLNRFDRQEASLSVLNDNYCYEMEQISMYLKMRMRYVPVIDIDLHDECSDPGADNDDPETCAICILEYQNGDIRGKLQCEHEFHVDCIKKWLLRKKVCPLCRGSVVPAP